MTAHALSDDAEHLDEQLRDRRALLVRTSETYLALADRLDDEIAAIEAAQRLANPAGDANFEEMLEAAEREATPD
ncbi:MAG: hypothetical protein ACKVUT_15860 [Gaiella sp.]